MARNQSQPTRTRRLRGAKPKQQGQGLAPCPECGGVECGSGRVPVCCEACGH
jgi:hypothetical protein